MNVLGNAFDAIKPRCDDAGMDRMSYYYSCLIITFLAVTITAKQYVGAPLQCWVPAQFTKAWEQYAENYCFVYNTYWVRPDDDVPTEVDERIAAQLIYYQWVPFIMALEAGLFHLPARIWGQISKTSGVNLESLVKTAIKADEEDDERKNRIVKQIGKELDERNKLQQQRNIGASKYENYKRLGELDGTYLSNLYMFTKVLYCTNIVGQFWMMNKFLKQPDHLWGASILRDIVSGTDWELSGNFPRIAMCDFQVRTLGNLQRYSIQCVLLLNMFNEKIFLFLYWWIIFIGIFTFADAILLGLNSKLPSRRRGFIRRYLECRPEELALMEDFSSSYINPDMFLILKMIAAHSSDIITSNIIHELWKTYRQSKATIAKHSYLLKHISREDNREAEEDPTEPLLSSVEIPISNSQPVLTSGLLSLAKD